MIAGLRPPGAHGLTLFEQAGKEFLLITDTERHQIIKTDLSGNEIMVIGVLQEIADYKLTEQFKPTQTAVAPNGDIYVTDGYGLQFVIQYDQNGKYILQWGGRGDADGQFDCVHGIGFPQCRQSDSDHHVAQSQRV